MSYSKSTILDWWHISIEDLTEVVKNNPSLKGMILGYLAEIKVKTYFEGNPHITSIYKNDDHDRKKKGDLVVVYKGHEFIIEVKSLQTNSIKKLNDGTLVGKAQCDASDRREVFLSDETSINTTCLKFGEFDILAVNLFQFNHKWDYGFILN